MSYVLEINLPGLPKLMNSLLRGGWRAKHSHAKKWKRAVWAKAWALRPHEPLTTARVTVTRCSSRCPDFDGLVSSGKALIDGLVESGVLIGDSMEVIGQPSYQWEKAPANKGFMKLKVESITTTKEIK